MEIKKFKVFEQEITLSPVTQPTQIETDAVGQTASIASVDQPKEKEQETPIECDTTTLFSKLFEARQMAHVYHLQVKGEPGSHASHTALGDYYDSLLGLTDDIIETYQGQYGIVENYLPIDTKGSQSKDKVTYFEELVGFIKTERKCFGAEDSHLQNIIDEIVALNYRLLYKLKYTK